MQLVAWLKRIGDDQQLAERLKGAGISVRPVSPMYSCGSQRDGLLLGFAAWNEREIEKAVRKMASALA